MAVKNDFDEAWKDYFEGLGSADVEGFSISELYDDFVVFYYGAPEPAAA